EVRRREEDEVCSAGGQRGDGEFEALEIGRIGGGGPELQHASVGAVVPEIDPTPVGDHELRAVASDVVGPAPLERAAGGRVHPEALVDLARHGPAVEPGPVEHEELAGSGGALRAARGP